MYYTGTFSFMQRGNLNKRVRISLVIILCPPGGGGGGLPYEIDGDARRLA